MEVFCIYSVLIGASVILIMAHWLNIGGKRYLYTQKSQSRVLRVGDPFESVSDAVKSGLLLVVFIKWKSSPLESRQLYL